MKFKNIRKEAKKKKSPSNSRTIPAFVKTSADKLESFKLPLPKVTPLMLLKIYRGTLKVFIALIFLLAVFSVGMDLQKNFNNRGNIDMQRAELTKELKFWQDFITEHKDYRDAYFQASILEYKLGKINQAKIYLKKGLSLDPNSQDGRKLEDFFK